MFLKCMLPYREREQTFSAFLGIAIPLSLNTFFLFTFNFHSFTWCTVIAHLNQQNHPPYVI